MPEYSSDYQPKHAKSKQRNYLTAAMSQAAGLLFCGMEIGEVARKVGKCRTTVVRWQANPIFQAALDDLTREVTMTSVRRLKYARHRLLERQLGLLESEDEQVALRAAHQLNQICRMYPREGEAAAVEQLELPTLSREEIQAEILRCRRNLAAMEEPAPALLASGRVIDATSPAPDVQVASPGKPSTPAPEPSGPTDRESAVPSAPQAPASTDGGEGGNANQ